jgi:hypothetical protein
MKATLALTIGLAILFLPCLTAAADEGGEAKEAAEAKAKEKPATGLQKLLKELRSLVVRESAKPEIGKGFLEVLEKMIKAFEKEKPAKVTLEDLSEVDRERLKEELRGQMVEERRAGGGAGGGEGADWATRERNRRVERSLEGVSLKDDQREKVEEMLGEFFTDAWTARSNREYGLVNDLKRDLEKRLKRVVGSKMAKDIINNVNRQLPGRRW